MSDSEKVINLVSSLTKVSNEILSTMLPLMQTIVDHDNEFVDEITYSTKIEDKKEINLWLQEFTSSLIINADNTKRESAKFLKSYEKGPDFLDKNIKEYPFLAEVWFGDIYDGKEELEAFQSLLEELNSELSEADEDFIIKKAIKHFST